MKKLISILLILLLVGCSKPIKETEIGNKFITGYKNLNVYTKVERELAPEQLYDLVADYIEFDGEYKMGHTNGFFCIIFDDKHLQDVWDYCTVLSVATYGSDLIVDEYEKSVIFYNDEIPITIAMTQLPLSDGNGYLFVYEVMEMTYEQAKEV
jgi:hypothetical protein